MPDDVADSKLMTFHATPGELVSIRTPDQVAADAAAAAPPPSDFDPNPKVEAAIVAAIAERPPFNPQGRIVARTELRVGDVTYFPTAPMPPLAELEPFGIDERQLLVLWRNYKLDTYPDDDAAAAVTNVAGAPDASTHDRPLPGTQPPKPAKKSKR